jgi:predicted DNA-binding ribbon-helix-helix protein
MLTMLEVEPELASKIQARARERGVSVAVYLRELIDEKGTESNRSDGLSSQERVGLLRQWASGHSSNTPHLSDDAISRERIYGERG